MKNRLPILLTIAALASIGVVIAGYYLVQTFVNIQYVVKKGQIEINLPTINHENLVGGDVDTKIATGSIKYPGDLGLSCKIKISDVPEKVIAGGFTGIWILQGEKIPFTTAWTGVIFYISSLHKNPNTGEVNTTWLCKVVNLTCISNLWNCWCYVINDTAIRLKVHAWNKIVEIDFTKLPKCEVEDGKDLCYVMPIKFKVDYNYIVEPSYPIYIPGNKPWNVKVIDHVLTEYVNFTKEETYALRIDLLCNPPIK